MREETNKLKRTINSHLEDEVQRLFRQEKDREGRKLDVIARGTPLQPGVLNDKTFI